MRIKIKHVIWGLLGVIAVAFIAGFSWWYIVAYVPRPKSDVPITYKIGYRGAQNEFEVTSLEVVSIHDKLNMLNEKALVEYRIKGYFKPGDKGRRAYVGKVQLSERWLDNREGEIRLELVTYCEEEEAYNGEAFGFDIKVQAYLSTSGWAKNTYKVYIKDIVKEFSLFQAK